jgi:hypothetical protein
VDLGLVDESVLHHLVGSSRGDACLALMHTATDTTCKTNGVMTCIRECLAGHVWFNQNRHARLVWRPLYQFVFNKKCQSSTTIEVHDEPCI